MIYLFIYLFSVMSFKNQIKAFLGGIFKKKSPNK
jgi:hypothetical protein